MVLAKFDRANVEAPMTCFLCKEVCSNATTSQICLHTFCKECIEQKIADDDIKHCPQCNEYWGCSPLNKLKLDGMVQTFIEKHLSSNRKSALPKKLEKGTPSSLKANAKNMKVKAKRVQNSSKGKSSKKLVLKKTSKGNAESCKEEIDMTKPLNSIVKATRKMKLSDNNSTMKETDVIPMSVDSSSENNSQVPEVQHKKHYQTGSQKESKLKTLLGSKERKVNVNMNLNLPSATPVIGSSNKSNNKSQSLPLEHDIASSSKSKNKFEDLSSQHEIGSSIKSNNKSENLLSQHEIGSSSTSNYVPGHPVWLSLVPSENKEAGARLPKISRPFLRVVDSNAFVSIVEKYVIESLNLPSDAKVEISLWGQPVSSWWKLQNLAEIWKRTMPKNEKIMVSEGSSAEEFVMVCSYGLKA